MFRRKPCRCERLHRDLEATIRSVERIRTEVEEDLNRVMDQRREAARDHARAIKRNQRADQAEARALKALDAARGETPENGDDRPDPPHAALMPTALPHGPGPTDRQQLKAAIMAGRRQG